MPDYLDYEAALTDLRDQLLASRRRVREMNGQEAAAIGSLASAPRALLTAMDDVEDDAQIRRWLEARDTIRRAEGLREAARQRLRDTYQDHADAIDALRNDQRPEAGWLRSRLGALKQLYQELVA